MAFFRAFRQIPTFTALMASGALATVPALASGSKKAETRQENRQESEEAVAPLMGTSETKKQESVNRQLLVAFESAKAAEGRAKIFEKHGVKELEKVGMSELYLVEYPLDANPKKIQEALSKEQGVRYAEPNLILRTFKN